MELKLKLVSALEKIMPDAGIPGSRSYRNGSALRGERFAFQLAYSCGDQFVTELELELSSPLGDAVSCRKVELVPVRLPGNNFDDDMIGRTGGMFPDLLDVAPARWIAVPHQWRGIWVSVDVPRELAAGVYPVKLTMRHEKEKLEQSAEFSLEVIDAELPTQEIERTEWLYGDCIANYYQVPVWSERFWELLERYFRNQTAHGCTRLLTPLFTPPLDTQVGAERLTVQLVDVCCENGVFRFNFDRLGRWMKLAQECGYSMFEFAHLFTQWGASATPKIEVEVEGRREKMFGWHVAADSAEYRAFLEAMMPELLAWLEAAGLKSRCVFHVSDEPNEAQLDNYRYASGMLRRLAGEVPVTDAMSEVEFYEQGLCAMPVPCINCIDKFRDAGIPRPWTYYCCGPDTVTTNRFINFPGARTRMLGFQLYMNDCAGFLHWGYNFWNSRLSKRPINPFVTTDADGEFPAGDPFLVYPGENGPLDSLRHEILLAAFQDHRALKLLEALQGREATVALLESLCCGRLTVEDYPHSTDAVENLRYAVNRQIQQLL